VKVFLDIVGFIFVIGLSLTARAKLIEKGLRLRYMDSSGIVWQGK